MGKLEEDKWIKAIVNRVAAGLPRGSFEYEDLLSAAYVGLLEAQERFDDSKEVPFKKYAYLRVRGAVIDQVRKDCFLSVTAGKNAKLLKQLDYASESVSKEEKEQLNSLAKNNALAVRTEYLDGQYQADEIEVSIEERLDQARALKKLPQILENLSELERQVIEKYYFIDSSFQEIAEQNSLTKSGVWKIHSRALKKIKQYLQPEQTLQAAA